jgi:hypothetical protein
MNSIVLDRATEAIFYFQYTTKQAVNYVVKNAQTDVKTAKNALNQVMLGYKM